MSVRAALCAGGGGGRSGAISVVQVLGADGAGLDAALTRAGCGGVEAGESRLRRLGGAHEVMVARVTSSCALLTAHDGEAAVRGVLDALREAGIGLEQRLRGEELFPESADAVEARAMVALASAASPRAIPLLLAQRERWAAWDGARGEEILARSEGLEPLLRAGLIAAVGRTNVGKSTLLNALAGRSVSIVADAPGVTRDHVGATLVLDGVAARWVDTPGVMGERSAIEDAAWGRACEVIGAADVVVVCGDAASGFVGLEALPALRGRVVRVGTRGDLGEAAGADVVTSAARGEGLEALARAVRRALVSDEALSWEGAWAFDEGLRARVRESMAD